MLYQSASVYIYTGEGKEIALKVATIQPLPPPPPASLAAWRL